MRRRATEQPFSRFTPLLESGSGLRSRRTSDGISAYKGVTIIKAGLGNHRDRNFYPAETLEKAVKSGQFDGLRAYADHPDSVSEEIQPERTVRDLVGVYQNPRFLREGRTGGRIVADLHLVRSAKWLSETIDDLIALKQADKIGLSINGRGRTVEKSMQLEESADPVDVNYVEEFMALRSADVVTEAGAGGGFQQLLESAKGTAKTKENGMNGKPNAKQKKAIEAAQKKGDWDTVAKILKECGCGGAEAVESGAGKGKKKGSKGDEAADVTESRRRTRAAADAEEADEVDEADEGEDEVDPLDAEHEAITTEADELSGDDEDDDLEEADEEELDPDIDDLDEGADDEDDLEEADEEDEPVEPRRGNGRHPLAGGAERIRAAAARTRDTAARSTREASRQPIVRGGAGVVTRAKGSHRNNARGPGNGQTAFVGVKGLRGGQRPHQKGRRFGESQMDSPEITKLQREVEKLRETNTRLSTQLRVRTTADRARNLLRESAIPEKMRPEILRLMVGKSEEEMQRVVRYHERLIESAVDEIGGSVGGRVEGAGSTRIRESHHGGGGGDDVSTLLEGAGIPLIGDSDDE